MALMRSNPGAMFDVFVAGASIEAYLNSLYPNFKDGKHVILHENTDPKAHKLHQTEGFYVYDDQHLERTVDEYARSIDIEDASDDEIEEGLKEVAREQVGYYKEYVGGSRPAGYDYIGEFSQRPKRRGGWGDRRGSIASSYTVKVNGKDVQNLPGPKGQDYYVRKWRF